MPETASRETDLLGESVSYDVRRSGEAVEPRIDIDIRDIVVVLPEESETNPETLLLENAAWVIEKKQKYDSYRDRAPERRFEERATFPYLGAPHEVVIERRSSSDVSDSKLRLAKHHVEQTSVKRALETLYRRRAQKRFKTRADYYATEMGLAYERIEIRNQRTKWGSCSSTGTLGLNWRLMMASPNVLNYIIIHELAHLREPNHTDAFWSLVAEYDSDYKEHAEWLEAHSTQLIFSNEDF